MKKMSVADIKNISDKKEALKCAKYAKPEPPVEDTTPPTESSSPYANEEVTETSWWPTDSTDD